MCHPLNVYNSVNSLLVDPLKIISNMSRPLSTKDKNPLHINMKWKDKGQDTYWHEMRRQLMKRYVILNFNRRKDKINFFKWVKLEGNIQRP